MNGWVKIYRKVLENPIVMKDATHIALWVYLLMNAAYEPTDAVFRGKRITLQPGQLITSMSAIAKELSVSRSNIVRTMSEYTDEQQIVCESSNQNTLISIVNWDAYQQSLSLDEQRANNECTTSEQQANNERTTEGFSSIYIKEIKNYIPKEKILSKESMEKKGLKHKYGEYGWVQLTDTQYEKLISEFGENLVKSQITFIDESAQKNGNRNGWKDWNLVIRKSIREGWGRRYADSFSKEY